MKPIRTVPNLILLVLLTCLFRPAPSWADVPPDVNAYLATHPALADAIRWEMPTDSAVMMAHKPEKIAPITKTWLRSLSALNKGSWAQTAEDLSPLSSTDSRVSSEPGVKWAQWPDSYKNKLAAEFITLWNWMDDCWNKYTEFSSSNIKPDGFDACFNTAEPANYPPTDLQWMEYPPAGVSTWTVISSPAAFDLFSKMVALSLVIEMKGLFPWTLAELTPESLREILDGTLWFHSVPVGPSTFGDFLHAGHVILTSVLPAPPTVTLSFLAQNKLIGNSKLDTVVRLFTWEQYHLKHVVNMFAAEGCPYVNTNLYAGGYPGKTPLSRVINGTEMLCPTVGADGEPDFYPGIYHWTGGCAGNSAFHEQVLRVVQIPAQRSSYAHFQNNFVLDGNIRKWIGHADNPIDKMIEWKGALEFPIEEYLVDDAVFLSWVVDYDPKDPNLSDARKEGYEEKNKKAVSRRKNELSAKHLPKRLLSLHCQKDLGKPHHETYLFTQYFSKNYTLAELESLYFPDWGTKTPGLWQNIESKIAALGGCEAEWP